MLPESHHSVYYVQGQCATYWPAEVIPLLDDREPEAEQLKCGGFTTEATEVTSWVYSIIIDIVKLYDIYHIIKINNYI